MAISCHYICQEHRKQSHLAFQFAPFVSETHMVMAAPEVASQSGRVDHGTCLTIHGTSWVRSECRKMRFPVKENKAG